MRTIKVFGDSCQGFTREIKIDSQYKHPVMNTIMTPELREVMEALHYRPAISIILPFEPKMNLKTELAHSLKTAADKVEL